MMACNEFTMSQRPLRASPQSLIGGRHHTVVAATVLPGSVHRAYCAVICRIIALCTVLASAAVGCTSSDQLDNPGSTSSRSISPRLDAGTVVTVDTDRNLLSVDAEDLTLGQIIAQIEAALDIRFIGFEESNNKMNIQFDFLPLKAALEKLLIGQSYILENDLQHGEMRVWLLPFGEANETTAESNSVRNTETMTYQETQLAKDMFYGALQGGKNTEELADKIRQVEQQLSQLPQTRNNQDSKHAEDMLYEALQGSKNTEELVDDIRQLEQQLLQPPQIMLQSAVEALTDPSAQEIDATLSQSFGAYMEAMYSKELVEDFNQYKQELPLSGDVREQQ